MRMQTYPDTLESRATAAWREQGDRYMTPNFGSRRLAMVRGAGARLWDAEGREYLDFLTGISVNNLGHCHPRITEAIQRQAETLVHCSNIYNIPVESELAQWLVEHSFADRVSFANSGAEANEAAIKIARRHIRLTRGEGHHEIITALGSFHGRTLATLTATGQDKVKLHFEPLPEGFRHVPFGDLAALESAIGERTGAIMLEPIQGEGGINIPPEGYLPGVRELCDRHGLLLIMDEVQTGLGRTGKLFGYEHEGIAPDILTLAKSLGGGLPLGAMLCTEVVAQAFAPGAHGSTQAGNPLACAAALAYLHELEEGDWPARGARTGQRLMQKLDEALQGSPIYRGIRGRGMMIGIQLSEGGADLLKVCEAAGLLVNIAACETMRLLPPLNVTEDEVDRAVAIIAEAVRAYRPTQTSA